MLNPLKFVVPAVSYLLLMSFSFNLYADQYTDTLSNFMTAAKSKIMIEDAYAHAIFPTIGKGGFTIGAAYGKGKIFVGNDLSGDMTMSQLSFGLQFGGQAYSQLVLLKDKRAFNEFISGSFEFGAQATAVALTLGANVEASTRGQSSGTTNTDNTQVAANYYKGMAVYTIAKGGLMYEAALAGQKFEYRAANAKPGVKDLSIQKIE